jgi:hypothetical protein
MEFLDENSEDKKKSPNNLWYLVFSGMINVTQI